MEAKIHWFHAGSGPGHLDLLSTPIARPPPNTWHPFTIEESERCEAAFQKLSKDEQENAETNVQPLPEEDETDDESEEQLIAGVPIGKDKLFEVDVKKMILYAVFWHISGPPIKVTRALWLYDENHPVERTLSDQLEEAYSQIKPWKSSYQDELKAALEMGAEAHDKLKYKLKDSDLSVVFQDASSARLISSNMTLRLSSVIFSSWRGTSIAYPGATLVVRGYSEALARKTAPPASSPPSPAVSPTHLPEDKERRGSFEGLKRTWGLSKNRGGKVAHGSHRSTGSLDLGSKSKALEREVDSGSDAGDPLPAVANVGEQASETVTDLVLIIHGIGQGLTAQYEAFNFVYATNLFRQVARKQSTNPALSSIIRSKHIQFLPVQWRASLKLGLEEERARHRDGLDNNFALADITIPNSIPFVRDLTNNVLIDVPYFMSHHRTTMIESVCTKANRIYRLWCARNPEFSKNGRVHIIGHSLGSVLASYVLSKQPTIHTPIEDCTSEQLQVKDHFLFNTSSLFLVGSPLGVFIHLNQAQLIARKGRLRTKRSPPDEALDRAGVFGCLAVDSLYNIFTPSDPIAYLLNPCVDSKRAKELPPSPIPAINATLLSSISTTFTKMFDSLPAMGLWGTSSGARSSSPKPASPRSGNSSPLPVELAGPEERLTGTRAERRFAALNPHGTLDFLLPSEGAISEYVDMITAHSAYWSDANFAAFVLAEICAKREDLIRTGLGPPATRDG